MKRLLATPASDDRAVAACHKIMILMRRRPDLWPLLNVLALGRRVDWPAVLAELEAGAAGGVSTSNNGADLCFQHRALLR